MNKEVEELIDRLKQDSDCEYIYWVGYVDGMNCDEEITSKEMKLLLDYINQLETNRDAAIEYIENNKVTIMGAYGIPIGKAYNLKEILERGKANE